MGKSYQNYRNPMKMIKMRLKLRKYLQTLRSYLKIVKKSLPNVRNYVKFDNIFENDGMKLKGKKSLQMFGSSSKIFQIMLKL